MSDVPPTAVRAAPAGATARGINTTASLGLLLLALSVLPLYRLLSERETGLAGRATVFAADASLELLLAGLVLFVLFGVVGGLVLPLQQAAGFVNRARGVLTRMPGRPFAALLAAVAGALSLAFSLIVLDGAPNHIDSISQALHARFWSEGRLAGPAEYGEFWMIQNSLFSPHGWVSQYPPGHVLLLAVGFLLGVPALVGPLLVAVTVFATARYAERILPHRLTGVRLGVVLLAVSPFVIALGASYMNHVTAAALLATAALLLSRARDGSAAWAVPAGSALGWAFATRPLTALVVGAVLVLGGGARELRQRPRLLVALSAGALPFVAALLAYNAYFFGSPIRFGYAVALGPEAGPGFGRDPWGNVYGPIEAIAYTSSDLVIANAALLEGALPVVSVVAISVLLAKRLHRAVGMLLAWAAAPVVANFFYWHHGLHMGPRMLYEAAPPLMIMCGVAVVDLVRRVPGHMMVGSRFALRSAAIAGVTASLLAGALLAPARLLAHRAGEAHALSTVPVPPVDRSIVFVHEAWRGRVAMRLAAAGMRLDSVEHAIRLNPTCSAQALADAIAAGDSRRRDDLLSRMDFRPRGTDVPELAELAGGSRIVPGIGIGSGADCLRQASSDIGGTSHLAPLIWRGALFGSDTDRPLFVRDLGPEANELLLERFPERTPFVLVADSAGRPTLHAYDAGVALLWNR